MKKLTTSEFIIRSNSKHNNKYDYSLVSYKDSNTKVKIICPIHGEFNQFPYNHIKTSGCSSCAGNKKLTISEFIRSSTHKYDNKYDYSLVKFYNNDSIIDIICPIHGLFKQRVSSHLERNGCSKCIKSTYCDNTLKLFISKSNIKHNNIFDYSLVVYKSTNDKVKIKCNEHGVFEKSPKNHLKGQGCPSCKKMTTDKFIIICNIKHNNKYDYSSSIYSGSLSKVKILCKEHGFFEQSASQHMRGFGCIKCSIDNRKISTKEFIDISNKAHNSKYDYAITEYTLSKSKVEIICPIHGRFSQIASDHMRGIGCKSCGSEISVSKLEIKWLDSLNIESVNRQYKISKYIVDGYDPSTNTIYEFNGDFWHGNPNIHNPNDINPLTNSTFGKLYENTLNKESDLKSMGYNVVSIWESDYKEMIKSNLLKVNIYKYEILKEDI